ncbi:hypothetical protein VQ056_02085 [Paenibacillus sp. JTLBN-2024]
MKEVQEAVQEMTGKAEQARLPAFGRKTELFRDKAGQEEQKTVPGRITT